MDITVWIPSAVNACPSCKLDLDLTQKILEEDWK